MSGYEEVEYNTEPVARAHPDHLHVVGRLFGLQTSAIETSRVLELACGNGGNLIPLAIELPNAEFLGIDLSEKAIDRAKGHAREQKLVNIQFERRDLLEYQPAEASYDYIIAHGLYSWVPDNVKQQTLKIIRTALSPNGVAFISFNCFPGWHQRCVAREFMILHTAAFNSPKLKVTQARAALDFLADSATQRSLLYRMLTSEERDTISKLNDWHLFHDYLEVNNDPRYFLSFMDEAIDEGLQYLADAELSQMLPLEFPTEVQERVTKIAGDILRLEQYLDFLRNRMFRRTLLVRDDAVLRREFVAADIEPLFLASRMKGQINPDGRMQFVHPNGGSIAHNDPRFIKALQLLGEKYPAAIAFNELSKAVSADSGEGRAALSSLLLRCVISDLLELRSR